MSANSTFRQCWAALLCCATLAAGSLPAIAQSNPDLEHVLDQMDKAHETLRSTQASFVWEVYTSAAQDTYIQKGNVYYRRRGNETQMALELTDPSPEYVLFTGGKLQVFEPRIDQVRVYDAQKNQSEVESFLVLGFGGGGHALEKTYELKYLGTEKVAGLDTAKLELVPKNPKVLNMLPNIVLWIDPARGISVQQQLFEREGNYRLAKYSDIQLNRNIPDKVFKLSTDSKTTFQSF